MRPDVHDLAAQPPPALCERVFQATALPTAPVGGTSDGSVRRTSNGPAATRVCPALPCVAHFRLQSVEVVCLCEDDLVRVMTTALGGLDSWLYQTPPGPEPDAAISSPLCRLVTGYTPGEMTSTLTPEQIEVYAATLRARTAETARRRRQRREQAWQVAREAAQVLRAQFGVTGVWVFGSLPEGDHFTERSDIDMAATGLTPALHLEALGRLLRLSPDFEFDLVDLDRCPKGLSQAVEQSGVEL